MIFSGYSHREGTSRKPGKRQGLLFAIIGIGILRKEGHEVSNGDFFKIGIPFTMAAIIPAYILIWILFGV